MVLSAKSKFKTAIPLLLACVLLYVSAVAGYAVWLHGRHKARLLDNIDSQLLSAAKSLKLLLADDFHDRALDKSSIPLDEELRNRRAFNRLAAENGFSWIYTLVEKDGAFFFAAPTVSEEEAQTQERWYFHPYDDIPPEFVAAWSNASTSFVEYSDQWGHFRSVAVAETSPGGRRYLACADRDIGQVRNLVHQSLRESIFVSLFFLASIVPFVALLSLFFRAHNSELRDLNAELRAHRDNLEQVVQERTLSLERERIRLQEALDNVKVLHGLIPICSSCKKVRDDKGYWNQLEQFLQAHSGASFSHGLCPDCLHKLYPE